MDERWEYKIVHVVADCWTGTGLPANVNEEFDRFGAEGWELVGTQGIVRSTWIGMAKTVGVGGFFKRPLRVSAIA